jgi:hypothetical protein
LHFIYSNVPWLSLSGIVTSGTSTIILGAKQFKVPGGTGGATLTGAQQLGIWVSQNNGQTWLQNNLMANEAVLSVASDPKYALVCVLNPISII